MLQQCGMQGFFVRTLLHRLIISNQNHGARLGRQQLGNRCVRVQKKVNAVAASGQIKEHSIFN